MHFLNRVLFLAVTVAGTVGTAAVCAEEQQQVVAVQNPMQVDVKEYLARLKLPPGFEISIYAENVTGARSMAIGPNGTLFVGTFTAWGQPPYGKVYAIRDHDGDGRADEVITIAEGLNHPNGVAVHNGSLYVAEISRILRYDDIENRLHNPPEPLVINDSYPEEFHHGWKFIRFGPDGRLYVPVGAPCNICEPEEPYSTITSILPDGSDLRIFARGIRNSVGFDWHPLTGELWFTDNGRDLWGDDRPPEELNHAPRPGLHFGYPYRYGRNLADDTFATEMKDAAFTPAALEMPAHRAPLGMRFYTGSMFPETFRNQILIAQHGSWNRRRPDGYLVSIARMDGDRVVAYEDFAAGWLVGVSYWGRPVDVEILPDGSLLISDDHAHVIYRVTYRR
jgi:glucose/arabinose dehydrogenase